MRFPAQATKTTRGVDGADVSADALEEREGPALGLDLTKHVLADAETQIRSSAREPLALLVDEVLRDGSSLLIQVRLIGTRLIQGGDGLVNLFTTHGRARLEPVGGIEAASRGLLGLEELADEDLPVRQGLLDDEGVLRVVLEGVADGGRLGRGLCGVVVAYGLDDFAELAVGVGEALVWFLDVHAAELGSEIGLGLSKS